MKWLASHFIKANTNENPRELKQLAVRGIPALVFYKRGVVASSKMGASQKAILRQPAIISVGNNLNPCCAERMVAPAASERSAEVQGTLSFRHYVCRTMFSWGRIAEKLFSSASRADVLLRNCSSRSRKN